MATNTLWRIAMRLLRQPPKAGHLHLELMSNQDLDHWLEDHRSA
jgi:hypothetical protein